MTEDVHRRQEAEIAIYSELFVGKRGQLRAYIFELSTALVWILSGLAFLLAPGSTAVHSPVGRNVGAFAVAWSIADIAGGSSMIAGVLRPSLALRTAGLILLGTALLMQFVAAATFAFDLRVLNYIVFAVACFLRVAFIVHTRERFVRWQKDDITPTP